VKRKTTSTVFAQTTTTSFFTRALTQPERDATTGKAELISINKEEAPPPFTCDTGGKSQVAVDLLGLKPTTEKVLLDIFELKVMDVVEDK